MLFCSILMLFAAPNEVQPPEGVKCEIVNEAVEGVPLIASVKAMTQGPKHHFFGYYGIYPWNASGKYLVCLESEFGDRLVEEDDVAAICLVDMESGELRPIADTRAWNFQQGTLLHWLGTDPENTIIYNDRVEGELRAIVLNTATGARHELPRPIAAVAPDGKSAASINYARLRNTRPGYGYAGVPDPFMEEARPETDGLYIMDTATGENRLIVSIADAARLAPPAEQYADKTMWLNHVLFSRDGSRLFFLLRHKDDKNRNVTAAFTVNPDGSGLRCILPANWGASHFDWVTGDRLVVTTKYQGEEPWRHVLWTDGQEDYNVLAPDVLGQDGHCHYSPDGQWMVTDRYPSGPERMRNLYLMNANTEAISLLSRWHEPPQYSGEWRCDLHPRWSRDGKRLCIDATSSGLRQVYVIELDWEQ